MLTHISVSEFGIVSLLERRQITLGQQVFEKENRKTTTNSFLNHHISCEDSMLGLEHALFRGKPRFVLVPGSSLRQAWHSCMHSLFPKHDINPAFYYVQGQVSHTGVWQGQ